MKLSDVAIDRPVFTSMMGVAAVVLGLLALTRLGVDLFPDIAFPIVAVNTPYPGAGPEEVEEELSRPIEEAVASIQGVDQVRSYSRDSVSSVVVTFKLETDMRQAASDVRDRVSTIRAQLPRDIEDPIISRIDPTAQSVATYAVSTERGPIATRELVDDLLRPMLERVEGVGAIQLAGGAERELRVELDAARLRALGMTVTQVAQALSTESFDVPGGRLTVGDKELTVKAVGRFRSPQEVAEAVLVARPDGTLLRVRDVGKVIDGIAEQRTRTRLDGREAVLFEVQKQGGSNTVAVVDGVQSALAKLRSRLPADARVRQVLDSARFVRNNLTDLRQSLIVGGLLAIAVVFLFMLDWRSTLISALALPTSVIASFFVMWQAGFTLNVMTMMGLSLAIGMLIDDSVVVRENIFRHLERGEDPMTAARKGTDEIALAVMATTFTIVAVFGPVAFTGGLVGRMFRQFGLTVSAAVLVSLLVSFTLDPMLSARIVQKIEPDHHARMRRHRVYGPLVRGYDALDAFYRRVLEYTLDHKKTVMLAATLLFVGSLQLTGLMGTEFFGRADMGDLTINVELDAGTSLDQTDRIVAQVEALVRQVPEVATVATTLGPRQEVHKAVLRVRTVPKDERQRSLAQIMETLRPKLASIPGLVYNMREAAIGGDAESAAAAAPIVLYVRGGDYGELGRVAQEAHALVKGTFGVRDDAISYRPGMPEQRLVIDRERAADLGVPFPALAATLRTAIEGQLVGKYRQGEHDLDIRVQLRGADRATLEQLGLLEVPSTRGANVRLREVTTLEEAPTPATIERLDRERQVTITANVAGRSLGEVLADLGPKLERIKRPAGYTFRFSGEAERMQETFDNLLLALGLAVLFIYMVLASQFESLLHPFTIMLSLPLAIVGALSLLFLADQPIGMPSMIGIILLMGLVTKNAILLVDYTNQLRERRGLSLREALLEAGPTRLRPILMTSAAMVLGMLPNAISRGEGSEFRSPMSIAVIGGVITSTVLTLVVVPVVYVWVDRFTLRGRRERRAAAQAPAERPKLEAAQ